MRLSAVEFNKILSSEQAEGEVAQKKCHLCPKTFSKISNLRAHINGVHEKLTNHSCDQCTYSTNWKSDLRKHFRKYHSKNLVKMPTQSADYSPKKLHSSIIKDEFSIKNEKSVILDENSHIIPKLEDQKTNFETYSHPHPKTELNSDLNNSKLISELNSEPDPLDVTRNKRFRGKIIQVVQSAEITQTTQFARSSIKQSQIAQSTGITQTTQAAQSSEVAQLNKMARSQIAQSAVITTQTTQAAQFAQSSEVAQLNKMAQSQVAQSAIITQTTQSAQSSIKPPSSTQILETVPNVSAEMPKPDKKCNFCDKTFRQNSNLKAHINGVHTNVITYCCEKCDYITSYKSDLKKHLAKKHDTNLEKSNVEKIIKLENAAPKIILSDGEIAKLAKMTRLIKSPDITLPLTKTNQQSKSPKIILSDAEIAKLLKISGKSVPDLRTQFENNQRKSWPPQADKNSQSSNLIQSFNLSISEKVQTPMEIVKENFPKNSPKKSQKNSPKNHM